MGRARGANALMALAFETGGYGITPASGFIQMPFANDDLGDEQGLVASDLLGLGRDPFAPALDVIKNEGTIGVPVDLRYFGHWLKLHFGAPTTTAGLAAVGSYTFSAQPTASSKITIGSTDVTFVTSGATGNQVLIGTTLLDTLTSLVIFLNSSADVNLSAASYALDISGNKINIEHKTIGTAGNTFATTAGSSPASNATASGATLAGGATTGAYNHVFASGALTLPSASIEVGNPDVPSYGMNVGVVSDKIAINLQRSGLLNATISYIAQGESARTTTTAAGTPSTLGFTRFSQFIGQVTRAGVPLGDLVSGNFTVANNYDKIELIRPDGKIAGADPGAASYTGQAVCRFKDVTLRTLATNGTPIDLTYSWRISQTQRLALVFHEVYLPRPNMSRSGPGGIQETYEWQAARNAAKGRACTATLVNDVTSYA
jgi:hypothetical protein